MATFGKQKFLPQEGKKRNNLFFILPTIMLLLLLTTIIGAILTFQTLNKNMMKNHRQIERLQKQLDAFQESQFKVGTLLNEDFNTLTKQFKIILRGYEEIKSTYGKDRILFSEGVSRNEMTIEQVKEGILDLNLAIQNQRDELKILNENNIENLRKEFAGDFAKIIMFQNETKKELSNLMYKLNNQTQEAIGNLTKYYSEEQLYNNYLIMVMKNFLSFNDSTQDYNNTLNFSDIYSSNNTIERFYEVNNSTLSQRQNSTYNESNEVFPITLHLSKEIQMVNESEYFYHEEDLADFINHTDMQANKSSFSSLVLKKAGEIREFVSGTYSKAFEKLRNPFQSKPEITEEANKEERIEKEEVKEKNETNQLMTKGISAVREYFGNTFESLLGKLNSIKQQDNFTNELNETDTFRNASLNSELENQNNTSISLDDQYKYNQEIEMVVMKMINSVNEMKEKKEMKEEELEYEKQKVLSFEHMFDYLEYLLGKYSQLAGNHALFKEWRKNFSLCREAYESIRNTLLREENQIQSQKIPQKLFLRRIQKLLVKLNRVQSFPRV